MNLEMYQQNILDHYKHPRNFGTIEGVKNHAHTSNPLCGDELDFYLVFDGDKVSDVRFNGRGCTISIASASMLSEKLHRMDRAAISKLTGEEIIKMLGVPINPARIKCATLSLETAQRSLAASQ